MLVALVEWRNGLHNKCGAGHWSTKRVCCAVSVALIEPLLHYLAAVSRIRTAAQSNFEKQHVRSNTLLCEHFSI